MLGFTRAGREDNLLLEMSRNFRLFKSKRVDGKEVRRLPDRFRWLNVSLLY